MDVSIAVIVFAIVSALAGIAYGSYLTVWVFRREPGNTEMQRIAQAIQEGARAYLNRQYRAIGIVAAVLILILWGAGFWSDKFGWLTALGFLAPWRSCSASADSIGTGRPTDSLDVSP